jgi:chromosome segregation ATPase
MIEFDCPHCGNHLSHQDAFAGRDGWCRICKGVISIPSPGQLGPVESNLSPEQRYARLDRLFKHAVSIVDEYRQLQASLQGGSDGLMEAVRLRTEADRASGALRVQLDEASALYQSVEAVSEELRARLDTSESENAALRDRVETELSDAQAEITRREQENDELLERVLDVEQKLEAAGASAAQFAEDRKEEQEVYEKRLDGLRDELCAAEDEGVSLLERLNAASEVETDLLAKLEAAQAAIADDAKRLNTEIERLTSALEVESTARAETTQQLDTASRMVDRVPVLEEELESARAEIVAGDERHQALLQRALESEGALELAGSRASDARVAWETQRQQLLDELETYRTGKREAEEETAQIRAKGREAAADVQLQLDAMQADLAKESQLRIASEEREQRLQRNIAEANETRDDAITKRDQLSRRLDSELKTLESTRGDVAALRASQSDYEATEQATLQQMKNAIAERDGMAGRLDDVSEELQRAQRTEEEHRSQIAKLEHTIESLEKDKPIAASGPESSDIEALKSELKEMHEMAEELNDALDATTREKTHLEQRLIDKENHAAFSALEGVGYRSQFSSIAKQFFEQEFARQSGAQDEPEFDPSIDEHAQTILDAVAQLRK